MMMGEFYAYEKYFGENKIETIIVNNNADNDLKLLIFADSFGNCITEDIAAHFKEIYVIDTRLMYDLSDVYNTTFSLDDYLNNNDIDCILWLQYYKNLYFESTCYLHIDLNY